MPLTYSTCDPASENTPLAPAKAAAFRPGVRLCLSLPIALFTVLSLHGFLSRGAANGQQLPGFGLMLLWCLVLACLVFCARALRRAKDYERKELGIVLYALAVETWLWLLFGRSGELTVQLWLNTLFWGLLCLGIINYRGGHASWRRLMTMYLLKGLCFWLVSGGLFHAEWLFRGREFFVARVFLMYPIMFLAGYQFIVLGYIWLYRERREKKAKALRTKQ